MCIHDHKLGAIMWDYMRLVGANIGKRRSLVTAMENRIEKNMKQATLNPKPLTSDVHQGGGGFDNPKL